MQKRGFTLVEILTAVVIVTILVAIAVPLYEKTIERSRLAEARTVLNRLQDAKLHTMDNMGCTSYTPPSSADDLSPLCPLLKHLNIVFVDNNRDNYAFKTKDFKYSIYPGNNAYRNGVCAQRLGTNASTQGVQFLYFGLTGEDDATFLCKDGAVGKCESYGLPESDFTCDFGGI